MWEIDLRIVDAFSNVVYILCHATLINVHSMSQLFAPGRSLSAVGRDCTPVRMERSTDFAGPFCIIPRWHVPKYKQCLFDVIPFTTIRKSSNTTNSSLNILASPRFHRHPSR